MKWQRNSIGDWQAIGQYGDFLVWRDGGAWKGRYRSKDHKTHFFLPRGKLAEVKKSCEKNQYWERWQMKSLRSTEDDEQEAVVMYCNLLGIDVVHIPNEGKRSYQYAARLKRIGMQKGFPDLLFPYPRKNAHGLYIEMKRKGEKPTVEQIAWLKKLKERDYKAFLCQGFDEAKRVIDWYFEVEK